MTIYSLRETCCSKKFAGQISELVCQVIFCCPGYPSFCIWSDRTRARGDCLRCRARQ